MPSFSAGHATARVPDPAAPQTPGPLNSRPAVVLAVLHQVRSCITISRVCSERRLSCVGAVVAQWSDWTLWSECSRSCGGGRRSRSRRCLSADPQQCRGFTKEEKPCNSRSCNLPLKRGGLTSCPHYTYKILQTVPSHMYLEWIYLIYANTFFPKELLQSTSTQSGARGVTGASAAASSWSNCADAIVT